MKTNVKIPSPVVLTHEGANASRQTAEQELRRSVMACMLWEDTFYESGLSIVDRIKNLIPKVAPAKVALIAVEARTLQKLRHVPLLIVREMARTPSHKFLVAATLEAVIQRADEITEFLAIYWKEGKCSLSAQVKKGLARAFNKFNEYHFAKYNRPGAVKFKDALFLTHPNPHLEGGETVERKYQGEKTAKVQRHKDALFTKIVEDTLTTPDTWEVQLSKGGNKKEVFTSLMKEKKLGALAFIRNLRNMHEAKVDEKLIKEYSKNVGIERVLPFRFVSAAEAIPSMEQDIEAMMLRCLEGQKKLAGKTAILVDNSGSMYGPKVSQKSDIDRIDAACALAILIREVCEDALIVSFSTIARIVPARRGFALRDAIKGAVTVSGTNIAPAMAIASIEGYDRIIVVTDEQFSDSVILPKLDKGYMINVGTYKNAINYDGFTRISGWSDAVLSYIQAIEGTIEA